MSDETKRFNGAALFQVRKADSPLQLRIIARRLQWGRTFSSAESKLVKNRQSVIKELQWGRTFSSAERGKVMQIINTDGLLQWGRTFSSAERLY